MSGAEQLEDGQDGQAPEDVGAGGSLGGARARANGGGDTPDLVPDPGPCPRCGGELLVWDLVGPTCRRCHHRQVGGSQDPPPPTVESVHAVLAAHGDWEVLTPAEQRALGNPFAVKHAGAGSGAPSSLGFADAGSAPCKADQ